MGSRLWQYLQMMFPLHRVVPVSLLSFAVTWCTATTVSGAELVFHPRLVAGALSFTLFALLLRVMDEFKDYELDCLLFPDRPLVTGMVRRRDLALLGWCVVAALLALNAWQGPVILGTFLICFLYTLLMFKFFFWNKVRENLLLALVTHNPVVFLFQCYIISYHVQLAPDHVNPSRLLPVAFLFWLPWLTWEIARKIRAPKSEDDYETYSQIFGYRGACGIVTALVLAIFAGTCWVSRSYHGGVLLVGGIGLATVFAAYSFARFARTPSQGKAPLRPVIENYLLVFYGVFTAGQFFR